MRKILDTTKAVSKASDQISGAIGRRQKQCSRSDCDQANQTGIKRGNDLPPSTPKSKLFYDLSHLHKGLNRDLSRPQPVGRCSRSGRRNLLATSHSGKGMVKCSKAEVRQLKAALRWNPEQARTWLMPCASPLMPCAPSSNRPSSTSGTIPSRPLDHRLGESIILPSLAKTSHRYKVFCFFRKAARRPKHCAIFISPVSRTLRLRNASNRIKPAVPLLAINKPRITRASSFR